MKRGPELSVKTSWVLAQLQLYVLFSNTTPPDEQVFLPTYAIYELLRFSLAIAYVVRTL